jgi:2-hydroxychromene-2-carboxylate isomerase
MTDPSPKIEYYFSFISLWSYVGSLTFQDLVKRHKADVTYKPIALYALFDAGGGKPVRERPAQRQAYRLVEMERWRQIRNIPLVTWPKFYPANPSLAHRALIGAIRAKEDVSHFVHAGLKAVWADELNIEDPNTIVDLMKRSGLDGEKYLRGADSADAKAEEARLTEEAIARRLFGAPFYFYRDEPFWGQDRLQYLDQAIESGRPPIPFPAKDAI